MPSIRFLKFNLGQRVLTVVHAENALEQVLEAVRSLGFEPEVKYGPRNLDGGVSSDH